MEILTQKKKCPVCKQIKPLTEFYKNKNKKYGVQPRCKVCADKSTKKWRSENTERVSTKNKEHHRKHYREKLAEFKKRLKQYYESNKEKILERQRKYRKNNIEKTRETRKQWRIAHPEKESQYRRNWTGKNQDKTLAKDRNRRARKVANGGKITAKEWEDLKKKYDYTCLCCKKREPDIVLTLDHVLPLVSGGKHSINNAQPLCRPCNSKKGAQHIDYR